MLFSRKIASRLLQYSSSRISRVWCLKSSMGGVKPVSPLLRAASSCRFKTPRENRHDHETRYEKDDHCVRSSAYVVFALGLGFMYLKTFRRDELKHEMFPTVDCDDGSRAGSRSKTFNFIADTVEMTASAVVYIECKGVEPVVDTIFGHIVQSSRASGSGFIVDKTGQVLTNAHLVRNSQKVLVRLSNGSEVKGIVTFRDDSTDLALIQLQLKRGETVPYLVLGDSKSIRPGEWVIAMGSPLSLANTITAGIISCVDRHLSDMGLRDDIEYVQTDAMITRGNSGGPLVNLDGKVIGVNTMTAGPGISFAIPSNTAKEFLEVTKSTKFPAKKYGLGVAMLSLTPAVLYNLQMKGRLPPDITHGVLLVEVWSGGPADVAGLVEGDVIVKINRQNIRTSKDVQRLTQKGQPMEVEVIRQARRKKMMVTPT